MGTTARSFQAYLSETLRLAVVYRLAHELNTDLSSTDVLRRVLHAAAAALSTPHASLVALRNKELLTTYVLSTGGDHDPLPVMENVLANGLAGFVLHNYRTVIVNDIMSNPLWMPLPDEPLSPQTGSALCVPLIHAGEVVGVMTLAHPTPNYFNTDAINLTNTISEMGAAALSNAVLLEEARRARQQYRTLFDGAIVPIIITDLLGNIQTTNRRACEFLGYTSEEFLQLNIKAIHRMGTKPVDPERFEHLDRGLEVRFQSTVWTKDGAERPVQVYAKRINSGDAVDHIQWIEHDLTSQRALEQLRQDLSAMVYHDMRGPLGNIHTSLQALKKNLGEHIDPYIEDMITVATRSEWQVRRMLDTLLDVQRLEESSELLNRTTIALDSVIISAVEQAKPCAEDKNIRLELMLSEELPLLYLDVETIERVVINLLDNAIKYSPDGGVITLSTTVTGNEVYVRVKDTGPGIPDEAQQTIFDKFSRVKQRNMPHGVGLGLAFCKLAVEGHGGRIWVKNNDEGGSTFTFALPIEAPSTKDLPLLRLSAS